MTNYLESIYFKHGWPDKQWAELRDRKVPLSTKIPFDEWTDITRGSVPDLTLAHYLAARHIIVSFQIPKRIKDAIVMDTPDWIRNNLNRWNKDVGPTKYKYTFGDIRMREPFIAIAASGSYAYLPLGRNSLQLEKLALVVLDMSCDLSLTKATESMR